MNKKESDRKYYLKNRSNLIKKATEWNSKNRAYHREYDKKWRLKNPNAKRKSYIKRTYNITLDEYILIKSIQEGRCSICLEKQARLVIDHCHKSKKVRSLLCTTCNAGLGQFKDSIHLLEEAIKYLKRHETSSSTKNNS